MTGARALFAVVVVLILALGVWIVRNARWVESAVPAPLGGEARTNPFYAAQRFAQALGANASWEGTPALQRRDGILVISGWHWGVNTARRQAIMTWVQNGGRLVVDSTVIGEAGFQQWSAIARTRPQSAPKATSPRPTPDCHELNPLYGTGGGFVVCDLDNGSHLETSTPVQWGLADGRGNQVLRVLAGRGSITAINGTPFVQRQLLSGEHAALFVTATGLQSGDEVRFLSESDYPSLFALLWNRGAPIVVLAFALAGVWLWRAGIRFGPRAVPDPLARRSLEEQIRGTGDFALRYEGGEPLLLATRRALDEVAGRSIPGYNRMTVDDRIATFARLSGVAPETLAFAWRASRLTHRVGDAIRAMETVRRQLLATRTRG